MRNAGTFFVIFSLFLTTWAMVAYPGSTYYNAEASRYSFWANTISELGMTQNYRHEPLVLSQWLFSGAVASFSVSVWLFLSQAARTSLQHILAAAPALCLFAIPFLPADHWQPAHNYVFFAAVFLLAIVCAVFAAAGRSLAFAGAALVLAIYISFLIAFPSPTESPAIRTAHISLQKTVFLAAALFIAWPRKKDLSSPTWS